MRSSHAFTTLAALLVGSLPLFPLPSLATTDPDAPQMVSREDLERELQRMKRDEHLGAKPAAAIQELLDRDSPQIELTPQVVAIMTGTRMGGPDPWTDIAPTEIHGRKVKAVGVHFASLELENKEEEEKLVQDMYVVTSSPAWREKILALYPARTGLMVVVAPEDVPAIEHAVDYLLPERHSPVVRSYIGIHEGPPEEIYRRYIAPLSELPQALPVQWVVGNPSVYQDQRVTLAGYFSIPFEGEPQVAGASGNGSPTDVRAELPALWWHGRQPPWPILFASGHRGDSGDLSIPSKDLQDFRENGRPCLVTGVVRVATQSSRSRSGSPLAFQTWPPREEPSPFERPLQDPTDEEIKVLRLEIESIRETTDQDPSWQRVIDQGRKYVLPPTQPR
jgi:hypothetical protein